MIKLELAPVWHQEVCCTRRGCPLVPCLKGKPQFMGTQKQPRLWRAGSTSKRSIQSCFSEFRASVRILFQGTKTWGLRSAGGNYAHVATNLETWHFIQCCDTKFANQRQTNSAPSIPVIGATNPNSINNKPYSTPRRQAIHAKQTKICSQGHL